MASGVIPKQYTIKTTTYSGTSDSNGTFNFSSCGIPYEQILNVIITTTACYWLTYPNYQRQGVVSNYTGSSRKTNTAVTVLIVYYE